MIKKKKKKKKHNYNKLVNHIVSEIPFNYTKAINNINKEKIDLSNKRRIK